MSIFMNTNAKMPKLPKKNKEEPKEVQEPKKIVASGKVAKQKTITQGVLKTPKATKGEKLKTVTKEVKSSAKPTKKTSPSKTVEKTPIKEKVAPSKTKEVVKEVKKTVKVVKETKPKETKPKAKKPAPKRPDPTVVITTEPVEEKIPIMERVGPTKTKRFKEERYVKISATASSEDFANVGRRVQNRDLQWAFYAVNNDEGFHYYLDLNKI